MVEIFLLRTQREQQEDAVRSEQCLPTFTHRKSPVSGEFLSRCYLALIKDHLPYYLLSMNSVTGRQVSLDLTFKTAKHSRGPASALFVMVAQDSGKVCAASFLTSKSQSEYINIVGDMHRRCIASDREQMVLLAQCLDIPRHFDDINQMQAFDYLPFTATLARNAGFVDFDGCTDENPVISLCATIEEIEQQSKSSSLMIINVDDCCTSRDGLIAAAPSVGATLPLEDQQRLFPTQAPIKYCQAWVPDSPWEETLALLHSSDVQHVGFDVEWTCHLNQGASGIISVLQLALPEYTAVFHFPNASKQLWKDNDRLSNLKRVLEKDSWIFHGRQIAQDSGKLLDQFDIHLKACHDLKDTCRELLRPDMKPCGLEDIALALFPDDMQPFKKASDAIRKGNWDCPRFHPRQLIYAAFDAHLSMKCAYKALSIPLEEYTFSNPIARFATDVGSTSKTGGVKLDTFHWFQRWDMFVHRKHPYYGYFIHLLMRAMYMLSEEDLNAIEAYLEEAHGLSPSEAKKRKFRQFPQSLRRLPLSREEMLLSLSKTLDMVEEMRLEDFYKADYAQG